MTLLNNKDTQSIQEESLKKEALDILNNNTDIIEEINDKILKADDKGLNSYTHVFLSEDYSYKDIGNLERYYTLCGLNAHFHRDGYAGNLPLVLSIKW